MFGSRRGINKSHSSTSSLLEHESGSRSGIPTMRNWPLFLFLSGLVFFFYIFYVYQAVSTELSMKKEQLELQFRQQRVLKEEIIDLKADLEKCRGAEIELKADVENYRGKFDECQSSLRSIKLRSDSLNDEKSALDTAAKEKQEELEQTKVKLEEMERNSSSLRVLYDSQQQMIGQLNTTIQMLQTELAAHSAHTQENNNNGVVGSSTTVVAAPQGLPQGGQPITTTQSVSASGKDTGRKPADLGELIKQEKAAEELNKEVKKEEAEPLKEEERAAVENGEKPDPDAKKPEDELKGAAEMKDDVVEAKEDKEEDKDGALEPPGHPGDRVKMEEGLMVAEQQHVNQLNKEDKQEGGAPPAVQGGDYVDKDVNNDLDDEAKEDGALDAPADDKQ